MNLKDYITILLLGSYGGIVRSCLDKKPFNTKLYFTEAFIASFCALMSGLLLSNYTRFSIESIYLVAGLAGYIGKDILPIILIYSKKWVSKKAKEVSK